MKTKTLIIIVGIFIISIGSFLILLKKETKLEDLTEAPTNIEEPTQTPEINFPEEKSFTDKIDEKEQELINEKNKILEKNTKAYNKALENTDKKLCYIIKDEELKTKCIDNVYLKDATTKLDIEVCKQISNNETKTRCFDDIYYSLAINNNNYSYCEKIINESYKKDCVIRNETEKSIEKQKEENTNNQEIKVEALKELDVSICNNISDEIEKSSCINNTTYSFSIENKDLDTCNKIENKDLKQKCEIVVEQKIDEDKYSQAIETKSISSCDIIKDENLKFKCKERINFETALEKQDSSLCLLINDYKLKSTCETILNK